MSEVLQRSSMDYQKKLRESRTTVDKQKDMLANLRKTLTRKVVTKESSILSLMSERSKKKLPPPITKYEPKEDHEKKKESFACA